jgi:hypothetical protein
MTIDVVKLDFTPNLTETKPSRDPAALHLTEYQTHQNGAGCRDSSEWVCFPENAKAV